MCIRDSSKTKGLRWSYEKCTLGEAENKEKGSTESKTNHTVLLAKPYSYLPATSGRGERVSNGLPGQTAVSYTHLDVYKRQGTYKKECVQMGKKYFSVAAGGGTGRTLHPDNMAAGPASYGMTDTMGRMHSDAQFAGSSSVPAHVEMMGFLGMGNNPMVGATVAVAVAVAESLK